MPEAGLIALATHCPDQNTQLHTALGSSWGEDTLCLVLPQWQSRVSTSSAKKNLAVPKPCEVLSELLVNVNGCFGAWPCKDFPPQWADQHLREPTGDVHVIQCDARVQPYVCPSLNQVPHH